MLQNLAGNPTVLQGSAALEAGEHRSAEHSSAAPGSGDMAGGTARMGDKVVRCLVSTNTGKPPSLQQCQGGRPYLEKFFFLNEQ